VRDRYRQDVDRAVAEFGAGSGRRWTADQISKAKRICYRTVWTECDWRNWANPRVPTSIDFKPNDGYPPNGGSLDSIGIFQQRPASGWGSIEGSMSPFTATTRFLSAMLGDAPNWYTEQDEAVTCQRVQRSQFDGVKINPATGKPYPYAQNYRDRTAQTLAVEADMLYFTHLTEPAILPVRIPFVMKR
jgi:hypothetical protein